MSTSCTNITSPSCVVPPSANKPHLHVLLAGEHQFVVHDVVRGVAQAIQSRGGVQVGGHAGARVDVLADALRGVSEATVTQFLLSFQF